MKPKCRVNWNKPYRAGTICNYVEESTNNCLQDDINHCPCGGIVRIPIFDDKQPTENGYEFTCHTSVHTDLINRTKSNERKRALKVVHSVLEKLSIPLSEKDRCILREVDVEIAEAMCRDDVK